LTYFWLLMLELNQFEHPLFLSNHHVSQVTIVYEAIRVCEYGSLSGTYHFIKA
jgi:hypothetical protein